MKKVFSVEKYIEDRLKNGAAEPIDTDWAEQCDGLTKDRIRKEYGYAISDAWLVEVKDESCRR